MKYGVIVKLHKNFVEVEGNTITVGITSRPIDGKANNEVARKIATHFRISKSCVKIISGLKNKRKIVEMMT